MENLEIKYFDRIETMLGQMQGLKDVVGLILGEILEVRAEGLSKGELLPKYVAAQVMTNAIFDLLCYQTEKTREFVNSHI